MDEDEARRLMRLPPLRVMVAVMIGALVLIYVVQRIQGNEQVKNTPPAACQLMGGTWSWWDGWRCA